MIGETVSRYRITRQLGAGGMGVVYEALDTTLDRKVALKFLPPHAVGSDEAQARFVQEAKAASALDHPNICTIHEIAAHDRRTYIAMACYDGESLQEKIARGPLPPAEIVDIATQIATGMKKAHENGILHRDLKPANIIVTADRVVKIVDFGLAVTTDATRLTRSGASVGTPAYMAPERLLGQDSGPGADIWALGVMIHEMMEGRPPFRAEFEGALVYEIVHSEPGDPVLRVAAQDDDVAAALGDICGMCLAKDPAQRYASMAAVLTDLLGVAGGRYQVPGYVRARSPLKRRRLLQAAVISLAVVAGIWLGTRFFTSKAPATPTLAVLPLQDLADTDDSYADGITGELTVKLGRVRGMRVISRTSAMKYSDSDLPLADFAQQLGADLVLAGTIQLEADQVRVTVELVDAARNTLIWTDSFSRDVRDVLVLQSDIAREIAAQVLAEVSPAQEQRLTTTHRVEPTVFENFLRGKRELEDANLELARDHFERTVALDQDFALAHAGLATTLQKMGHYGWARPADVFPQAKAAARRALELDPYLAEAHTVLAVQAYQQDWDWAEAERLFQRALDLDPGGSIPYEGLANYLLDAGRFDECFAAARRGIELDPLNEFTHLVLGYMLLFAKEWRAAEDHFRAMIVRWPDYRWAKAELAWTYVYSGRPGEAYPLYAELGAWPGLDPDLVQAWVAGGRETDVRDLLAETKLSVAGDRVEPKMVRIARGHWALGEADSTIAWMDRIERAGATVDSGRLAYDVAVAYTLLGARDEALIWLTRACDLRAPQMVEIRRAWDLDALRDDPRFQAIEARVGFPES